MIFYKVGNDFLILENEFLIIDNHFLILENHFLILEIHFLILEFHFLILENESRKPAMLSDVFFMKKVSLVPAWDEIVRPS